jgi:hypothetical protein
LGKNLAVAMRVWPVVDFVSRSCCAQGKTIDKWFWPAATAGLSRSDRRGNTLVPHTIRVAKLPDSLVLKHLRLFADHIEGRLASILLVGANQSFSPDNQDMAALMDHLETSTRQAISEVIVESADQQSSFQFSRRTTVGSDPYTPSALYDEIEIRGDGFSKDGQLTQLYNAMIFLSEIFNAGNLSSNDEEDQQLLQNGNI